MGVRRGHGDPRVRSPGRPDRRRPGGPLFRPRPEVPPCALPSGDPVRRRMAGRGAGTDRTTDFLHLRDGPDRGRGGHRRPRRVPEGWPGCDRRSGGDRPEPHAGSSLGGFGKRRSSRKRSDDRGIQPSPEGRGTEGWGPAGAGPPDGAYRRIPCRLHRPLGIPRVRSPRGVPAEPRLAGLPGDHPSRHVCPPSGGNRFQETVSRGRAGCEAIRPVGSRSWKRPRRGGCRPGVQGRGGGRRSPRGPRRGGPVEGSRDPGDGAGGSFPGTRYRADAGTAPGRPVLSPRGVVPPDGPEDGGGGDGRGSGAGRRHAFEAGEGLRGDRGTGPPSRSTRTGSFWSNPARIR